MRTVPSENGCTVLTICRVVASATATVRSRLTAGKPRMFRLSALAAMSVSSVAVGEVDLPEEGHVLAGAQRDRLEDDLVVEAGAGEQGGLGPARQLDGRLERRADGDADRALVRVDLDAEVLLVDGAAQLRRVDRRIGRRRQRRRRHVGAVLAEADGDVVDRLDAVGAGEQPRDELR